MRSIFPCTFLLGALGPFMPAQAQLSLSSSGDAWCDATTAYPLTISFNVYVTNGTPPYTYVWSLMPFGGGESTTTTNSPTSYYTRQINSGGTFGVQVQVTDGAGQTASAYPVAEMCVYTSCSILRGAYAPGTPPLFYTSYGSYCPNPMLYGLVPYAGMYTTAQGIDVGEWVGMECSDVCPTLSPCGEGCSVIVHPPSVLPEWMVLDVQPACTNGAGGAIYVVMQPAPWPFGVSTTRTLQLRNALTNALLSSPTATVSSGTDGTLRGMPAGSYWLILHEAGVVRDSTLVEVPVLPGPCGGIDPRVFQDSGGDCARTTESLRPNALVEILPGPRYASTDQTALTARALPNGSYTATWKHPGLLPACSSPTAFSISGSAMNVPVDMGGQSAAGPDVLLTMSGGPARSGQPYRVSLRAARFVTAGSFSSAGTLSLTFDPNLGYVSASPAPTSVSANVLTWNLNSSSLNNLGTDTYYKVNFTASTSPGLVGTQLQTTAVLTAPGDVSLGNNEAVLRTTIVAANTTNEKVAATSTGASSSIYYIGTDAWIDYTIRFQNTGTDTAYNVLVTDTLPAALDPMTIEEGSASFRYRWSLTGNAIMKFAFPGVRLPPSSVNDAGSRGFVTFRIRPRAGQFNTAGSQVSNRASVRMDAEPPMMTTTSVLTAQVSVTPFPLKVDAYVLLGGPYVSAAGLMNDPLRSLGLLPTTEPYTALGYTHVGGGGETTTPAVLAVSGSLAIVDWVVVELRDLANSSVVLRSRSALVRRDGRVVAVDGSSPLTFTAPAGNYYVAVRHRNHLGAMTASAVGLSANTVAIDFRNAAMSTWGTNALSTVSSARVLWAGDATGNGTLKYTGPTNDRDPILIAVGSTTPNSTVVNVYDRRDTNLDGVIKYTGSANDRDIILTNVGSTTPNNTRTQQLP